jgi:hypothetical protein
MLGVSMLTPFSMIYCGIVSTVWNVFSFSFIPYNIYVCRYVNCINRVFSAIVQLYGNSKI